MDHLLDDLPVYGLRQHSKADLLTAKLWELTAHHVDHCPGYARLLAALSSPASGSMDEIPYLPVRLFKEHDLLSIERSEVFRVLTSSGTTGQVSRISLDRDGASLHARLLARTLQEVIGRARLPMLIVDSKSVTRPGSLSARGAGVLGMMNFGRDHTFALDEQMQLDPAVVLGFLDSHRDKPFLVFGFTFMVWQYLKGIPEIAQDDFRNATLIHSGGWKKLVDQSVSTSEFRRQLAEQFGLARIFNFYGMVEQIGTVFVESDLGDGSLTCPGFADVLVRDPFTLAVVPNGQVGLLQTVSLSPRSYPGHSLLTEDLGTVVGVDDTPRMGKRFIVHGRLPRAEARGCSDTAA